MSGMCAHRVGFGFDSHAFGAGGRLMLGGVLVDGHPALKGHSDGDAILHAVVDALLGAAALGDIGALFPDSDPKNKGLASAVMLERAMMELSRADLEPMHIDVTVVADRPRIAPHRAAMITRMSELTGLPPASVSIKGKTPEGLAWFPAEGGVAVWAVATVGPAHPATHARENAASAGRPVS